MEILLVAISALLASALTLFSGFGLGTLLMPVIALFFPIEIAIATTAIVHLANNLFKIALVGKYANRAVLLRFGVPAILCAFVGALVLGGLSGMSPLLEYPAFHRTIQILPVKCVIGTIILLFVILELSPTFAAITLPRKYLPYGGMISGFFGGLSGHQGAFRSMFLLKAGLTKEELVATGALLAMMVDLSRLSVYAVEIKTQYQHIEWSLVLIASLSAFLGAYGGSRMIKKVTMQAIQRIVSVLLGAVALGLMSGVL